MTVWLILCLVSLLISAQGDQCKDNQHCSDCDRTGHCLTDCDPGYFDLKCRSVCSKNCRNHSCRLSVSGIAACTEGCVPGYHGSGCNVRCDSPGGTCTACPGGCYGGYCQLGSSCVSGCVDSYYGTDCKTCSSRCKSCNRMIGLCKECRPEYFGPNCAYSCDHCLGSCEHGCAEGCLPGLYGTFCEERCSEKCGPDPASSTDNLLSSEADLRVCHRTSGDCIHGCREGWFGQQCSSPCSLNCGHNTCHSDSGKCTDGCTRGFYGGLCQHTCEVCLDGVCDQKTGSCTKGCYLTGPKCDSTCTFNCSIAECLRVDHCNQEDTSRRHSGIQQATLLTSLLFLVVGSVVSVTICCRRRVRMLGQHTIQGIIPHEAPRDEDQVPPDYCEIRDEDVDIVCELPGIRGDDSVTGAAPVMPVLADCFAPDCDSADSDAAPVIPVLADCFAPDCDSADSDAAPVIPVLADCFVADCNSADSDAATSEESDVDENTYTHLVRPALVDVPETVVNYVSPIEE